ncbi:MAG: nucleotidyltransferase domain-containing protein [Anaerolineaceae bacterium]|nr:nucleotidyltransferase domain-containing protein [Anaerolineaceae bacterium]
MTELDRSIERMADRICAILDKNLHGIWLHGSVVLGDFRPGWSDIDILVLTNGKISEQQAHRLVGLRQTMLATEPDDPYYRSFEGIFAHLNEYLTGSFTRLVYWGTSGERITDRWQQDTFASYELAKYGRSVRGTDDKSIFAKPSVMDLRRAVREHYGSIRRFAVRTDEKLYSCGWLLDIARCIYTLRNSDVIAKTQAGIWALSEQIFENDEPLRKAIMIRQDPMVYKNRDDVKQWLKSLGPVVQRYADVLEREMYLADPCGTSSLSFRKTKQSAVPDNILIYRDDQFDPAQCGGDDEPYFKLIHRLRDIKCPELPAKYKLISCGAEELSRHISECYEKERLSVKELRAHRTEQDLWLAVIDTSNGGRIAASGIAEFDKEIREGSLEWIQVSADHRRQGLGRYIVCELLYRMLGKADFVTVSGKMNDPGNPLALYLSCGFNDRVIWHIVRKRDTAPADRKRSSSI